MLPVSSWNPGRIAPPLLGSRQVKFGSCFLSGAISTLSVAEGLASTTIVIWAFLGPRMASIARWPLDSNTRSKYIFSSTTTVGVNQSPAANPRNPTIMSVATPNE